MRRHFLSPLASAAGPSLPQIWGSYSIQIGFAGGHVTGAWVCQEGEGLIPPLLPSCISLTMVQMAIASFYRGLMMCCLQGIS